MPSVSIVIHKTHGNPRAASITRIRGIRSPACTKALLAESVTALRRVRLSPNTRAWHSTAARIATAIPIAGLFKRPSSAGIVNRVTPPRGGGQFGQTRASITMQRVFLCMGSMSKSHVRNVIRPATFASQSRTVFASIVMKMCIADSSRAGQRDRTVQLVTTRPASNRHYLPRTCISRARSGWKGNTPPSSVGNATNRRARMPSTN